MDLLKRKTGKNYSPIEVVNYLYLKGHPEDLDLTVQFVSQHEILVQTHKGAIPSEFPWTVIPGRYEKDHLFQLIGGRLRFQEEPETGWSEDQRIIFTDEALQRKPLFLYYGPKGLNEIP
jgi:hypothetical protein